MHNFNVSVIIELNVIGIKYPFFYFSLEFIYLQFIFHVNVHCS